MEIRQFEAFAAVHETGSVTAAARLLDRSQPVVSRQLQDLEQELGFTLFTRTRPQVTLTEQGRQFLEEVRNVLNGLQQLESRSREIAEGRAQPLRIGSSLSLGHSLVPAALAALFESDQGYQRKLYLDVMPAGQIVSALLEGRIDLAITSLPLELGRCRLHWSAQAACMVALPAGHPLAGEASVSALQLVDTTVITPSNASRMRHRLSTALLHPLRPRTQRQVVTSSTTSAIMMVRAGLGIALVDPCAAQYLKTPGVVYRRLDSYVPYVFGALSHGDRPLSDEALSIVQFMREHSFQTIAQLTEGDGSGVPVVPPPAGAAPDYTEAASVRSSAAGGAVG